MRTEHRRALLRYTGLSVAAAAILQMPEFIPATLSMQPLAGHAHKTLYCPDPTLWLASHGPPNLQVVGCASDGCLFALPPPVSTWKPAARLLAHLCPGGATWQPQDMD